ncbi:MAG: hypothetical protein RR633_08750 [Acinetobacter sp.]
MGFWSSVGNGTSIQSDEVQRLAKNLATRYSTSATNQQTLTYIADFIERAKKKYPNTQYQSLFNAVAHAYEKKNLKYPEPFHIPIAMQYLYEKNGSKEGPKKSAPTPPHWYKQKSEEVEHHLKHIALIKLQLTKNLKDLQSQNGGHLWIDTDIIDPATETLQASLTQVQDLENRLQVLKLTYQDYL